MDYLLKRNWDYYVMTKYMLEFPLGMYLNDIVQSLRFDDSLNRRKGIAALLLEMTNLGVFKLEGGIHYLRDATTNWKEVKRCEVVIDSAYQRLKDVNLKHHTRLINQRNLLALSKAIKTCKVTIL